MLLKKLSMLNFLKKKKKWRNKKMVIILDNLIPEWEYDEIRERSIIQLIRMTDFSREKVLRELEIMWIGEKNKEFPSFYLQIRE